MDKWWHSENACEPGALRSWFWDLLDTPDEWPLTISPDDQIALKDLTSKEIGDVERMIKEAELKIPYYIAHLKLLTELLGKLEKKEGYSSECQLALNPAHGGVVTLGDHINVVENGLVLNGGYESNPKLYIDYILDDLMLKQGMEKVLALLCLCSVTSHGLSSSDYETVREKLAIYYGIRSTLVLSVLQVCAADAPIASLSSIALAGNGPPEDTKLGEPDKLNLGEDSV